MIKDYVIHKLQSATGPLICFTAGYKVADDHKSAGDVLAGASQTRTLLKLSAGIQGDWCFSPARGS